MNLLVDAHLFDGAGQGTKTYLKGLYTPLIKNKASHTFFMAANRSESVAGEFEKLNNVKYLQYATSNKYVRLAFDIGRIIKSHRIDVAHFQYIAPLIKSCWEVVSIHDLLFLEFPEFFPRDYRISKDILFKRSAKRAELVTTVSAYSKEQLVRHYGISDSKIVITPNGVLDLYWDRSVSKLPEHYELDRFILYVSRFEPRKNQLGLLKAYLGLRLWEKGIRLVFIGSHGIASPAFDQLYNSLDNHVRGQILMLEDIGFVELKAFYAACSLFVYPSFAEGFGIPPLEAAVCGATVICSNTTAMQEFDFFGDQLVNPNQENELQEKISYFLEHPVDPSTTNHVREIIRKRYNWEVSAETFWERVIGLRP